MPYSDVISAYGYGGALYDKWYNLADLAAEFDQSFVSSAKKKLSLNLFVLIQLREIIQNWIHFILSVMIMNITIV